VALPQERSGLATKVLIRDLANQKVLLEVGQAYSGKKDNFAT